MFHMRRKTDLPCKIYSEFKTVAFLPWALIYGEHLDPEFIAAPKLISNFLNFNV